MEFRWLHVPVFEATGSAVDPLAMDGQGLLCAAYTDEEYRRVRLRGSELAFQQAFGRWGVTKIWRDDLLPCPVYLRHVVLAAAGMDKTFFSGDYHSSIDSSSKQAAAAGSAEAAAMSSSTTIAAAAGEMECETWSIAAPLDGAAAGVGAGAAATVASPSSSSISALTLSLPCGVMLSSFLDGTFLGDRSTSVRSYLRANPRVMLQQPPESLKERYSG